MADRVEPPDGPISRDGEGELPSDLPHDDGAAAPHRGGGVEESIAKSLAALAKKIPNPKEKKERKVDWDAFNGIMRQYALIHGSTNVFCRHTRKIMTLQAAKALHSRLEWRLWEESTEKSVVFPEDVVFDPSMRADDDPDKCNLFIPGTPPADEAGDVSPWLGLLDHILGATCETKEEEDALRHWVLCWYAYPMQRPGIKLRSAIIFQGDQGAGKNLLNDVICDIYGRYAAVVGQDELEDKYNDWRQAKQFVVGDEVCTAHELGTTKNRLKALITGPTVQINPKGLARRQEVNCMNIVLLSNELRPVWMEETDRRYLVVWTPPAREKSFYDAIGAWRKQQGAQRLHRWLLDYDCGDFNEFTPPPRTRARARLIDMSRSSAERFLLEWQAGETGYPWCPGLKSQIFSAYRAWCTKTAQRFVSDLNTFTRQLTRLAESREIDIREWRGDINNKTVRCWVIGQRPEHIATDREWLTNCVDQWANLTKESGGSHDAPF